ncbi:MAG: DUF3365 domain-containing protein [Mariprofundaceae bacterium]|nr:DUF3365 domain-containing protein [Mariprofundaceae bacterium]
MSFKSFSILALLTLLASCHNLPPTDASHQADLQKEAASIVGQFSGILKPQLKKALHDGGPAHAIEVCSKTAPALAKRLAEETGWSIKRVSLKARNHHTATPDAWERSILKQFDQNQRAGKSPISMIASRVEHGRYRFMKAQAVAPVCLLCHGKHISPDVAKALRQYYPQDRATDYEPGQIRGAFSLIKRL